ncbi:MAG: hypothetical protein A3E84_05205 [Gammaproteobacteria bacterium RIFCSPHIGHO2_12_FULL_42_13]|nr:MAG: hypothetical protein A3E84_05205 [Gammaproteobacteria bacterium RIFCSPHIGHO2_12_FULL_42_13]
MQSHLFLNWDVITMLRFSKATLAGGDYVSSYYNINTPAIFYLYFPVILISNYFHLSLVLCIRLFTYCVGIISWFSSAYLLKNILKTRLQKIFIFSAIGIGFFLLPAHEFGQREHLMMMFALPYVVAVALRASQHQLVITTAFLIGLFSGLGLIIKPFFLILPIVLETYLLFSRKKISLLLRPEILGILFIHCIYLITLCLVNQNYLTKMLPILLQYDIKNAALPYIFLLNTECSLLMIFTFLSFAVFRFIMKKKDFLTTSFFLASVACFLEFMVAKRYWYYHELSALFFMLLTVVSIFCMTIKNFKKNIGLIFITIFSTSAILLTGWSYFYYISRLYNNLHAPHHRLAKIIKKYAENKTVLIMSETPSFYETVSFYGHAILSNANSFPSMVIPAISKNTAPEEDKKRVVDAIVTSLQKEKPALVIIDQNPNGQYFERPFEYLKFYAKYKAFRLAWAHYRFLKRIDNFDIYIIRPH